MVRCEFFRLPTPRRARGHEQRGARYAVVLQADESSASALCSYRPPRRARAASFRPEVTLDGHDTRVLVEQTTVIDPERLDRPAERLDARELRSIDEALMLVLGF
jgi:mRNA interferase MazF